MRPLRALVALLIALTLTACAREPALFSDRNARAHVSMLAGTIGSRPIGTAPNAQARDYIIDQLRLFGFDVRVQETDARRPELGRTARVANIIGVRRGARDEAVGLLSHYDSSPAAPGAADDALGVAVSLEAARVLAARADRNWSLMVLVTDGEEAGLMGAAALMTDPEVTRRLQAYLNLEAIGSASPVVLFESGPANHWLVRQWARWAPHPRGASFATEVYRRLPQDTDFTILARHDVPGLNFAAVGDSYAYHTARDTPDRLTTRAIREMGENAVTIVAGLDRVDITQRTAWSPTYFDVGGTVGVVYGPVIGSIAAAVALLAGVIGWVRVTGAAVRIAGAGRWLLTGVWTSLGAAAVIASMIGATWALRTVREVYHPWHARPDRLFLLLLIVGLAAGWGVARLGRWLPARAHGLRHPLMTWSLALPVWILLASWGFWQAPGAAFLWILPLLTAGLLLCVVPVTSGVAVRVASLVVLAVVGTLWLRNTVDFLRFAVNIFGRQPVITPVFVYAAMMTAAGVMLVPPVVAVTAARRALLRPSLMTSVLLLAIAVAATVAYVSPAYTFEQPLRRYAAALQHPGEDSALWEVASVEPGLDLGEGAPPGWSLATDAPPYPWVRRPFPFVFRTRGPSLGPPPATVSAFQVEPAGSGTELTVSVVAQEPGITIAFALPPGVTPARANLPGIQRRGRWTATYVAPPPQGVTFRATFTGAALDALADTRITVTAAGFPQGSGWQRLPDWLPQDRAVWTATATWDLPAGGLPPIAPVPPLR